MRGNVTFVFLDQVYFILRNDFLVHFPVSDVILFFVAEKNAAV